MTILKKIGRYLAWSVITGALGSILIAASAFLYLSPKLPSAESYRNIRLENPLRIYTADQKLIAEFGNQKRDPVKYEEIPPLLVSALIASEDSRFYSHRGVDLKALARSLVGIISGNQSGGASTLTMQVAKNISFEGENAYSRKFKEILLALQIERELNKEDIIEIYLNRIFFGISAYGVSAASKQFYDKPLNELSLAEMAMLVAILPSPNNYNPLASRELALRFRSRVLRRMLELNLIDSAQYQTANKATITAQRYRREPEVEAPYIAEMVRQEMIDRYGDLALVDGYEVYTTVDSQIQETANSALISGLENYDRRHGYRGSENHMQASSNGSNSNWLAILARTPTVGLQQAAFVEATGDQSITALLRTGESIEISWDGIRWAKRFINNSTWRSSPRTAQEVVSVGDLIRVTKNPDDEWVLGQVPAVNGGIVSIDPNDGSIKALTGGYDFYASKFNRITQAKRQPGSNFKPFLYSAALENGYTAASLINDAPLLLANSDYRPTNYDGLFHGLMRLKEALTNSVNLVSIRLFNTLSSDVVLSYVAKFGFDPNDFPKNDPTVAIGSHAVTPLTIATAYTVFANGGYKVEPYLIDRIDNFNDGEVFRAEPYTVCENCEGMTIPTESQINMDAIASPETETHTLPPAPRVIDEGAAYIMNTILRSVVTSGSGRPANRAMSRQDIKGKTGTTNDAKDLWFSGFNGNLVTTVYVGFDQPATLGNEQASGVALPIWIDFMDKTLGSSPESSMEQPDGLVTVRINKETGLRAAANDNDAIFEVFREGNVPDVGTDTSDSPQSIDEELPIF